MGVVTLFDVELLEMVWIETYILSELLFSCHWTETLDAGVIR